MPPQTLSPEALGQLMTQGFGGLPLGAGNAAISRMQQVPAAPDVPIQPTDLAKQMAAGTQNAQQTLGMGFKQGMGQSASPAEFAQQQQIANTLGGLYPHLAKNPILAGIEAAVLGTPEGQMYVRGRFGYEQAAKAQQLAALQKMVQGQSGAVGATAGLMGPEAGLGEAEAGAVGGTLSGLGAYQGAVTKAIIAHDEVWADLTTALGKIGQLGPQETTARVLLDLKEMAGNYQVLAAAKSSLEATQVTSQMREEVANLMANKAVTENPVLYQAVEGIMRMMHVPMPTVPQIPIHPGTGKGVLGGSAPGHGDTAPPGMPPGAITVQQFMKEHAAKK